ncbi:MAG TPA: hypothetical protein VMU64_01735 [Acidimicrobiales bacterium]|nr:hypothetical protein [Acidimicrobiales bacterium]
MDTPSTDISSGRTSHSTSRVRGRARGSALRVLLAACVALVTCVVTIGAGAGSGMPVAAAAAGPTCKFNGPAIGALVLNVTPGDVINIDCKRFPDSHPYLLIETSLLVAIDPAAAPLLTGQATSVPGLLAIIAALPEMNATSVAFPTSNSKGVLDYNYTVPRTQPLDPNATCPPTTEELNSGLIGCAVAMIDLESFKPVTQGTFVLNYKGQPYFPPSPTMAISTDHALQGQSVSLRDAPGAKTFWWLATLVSLYSNLGGSGGSTGPIPVAVRLGGKRAATNAAVTPATYSNEVFTPPVLAGHFIAKGRGWLKLKVSLNAKLIGIAVSNSAETRIRVTK